MNLLNDVIYVDCMDVHWWLLFMFGDEIVDNDSCWYECMFLESYIFLIHYMIFELIIPAYLLYDYVDVMLTPSGFNRLLACMGE